MPHIRLIASDVDGTLLTPDHRITPTVRDAVLRARAAGVDVVLASARGPKAMKHLLAELGTLDVGPVISYQGALVGQYSTDGVLDVLHSTRLDHGVARTVVEAALAAGATVNWYDDEQWFYSEWNGYGEWEATATGVQPDGQLGPDQLAGRVGPHKLMIPPSTEDPDLVPRLAAALPEGAVGHLSGEGYLEIVAPGVDKSRGLAQLRDDLGLAADQVAAVGDGPNDLGMFALAGTAVAMANASEHVRAQATFVTASNLEDGLAQAIDALLAR